MSEEERTSAAIVRTSLSPKEKALLTEKLSALRAYREAQARLTEANLRLVEVGIPVTTECW